MEEEGEAYAEGEEGGEGREHVVLAWLKESRWRGAGLVCGVLGGLCRVSCRSVQWLMLPIGLIAIESPMDICIRDCKIVICSR